jgi:hypothetical protein
MNEPIGIKVMLLAQTIPEHASGAHSDIPPAEHEEVFDTDFETLALEVASRLVQLKAKGDIVLAYEVWHLVARGAEKQIEAGPLVCMTPEHCAELGSDIPTYANVLLREESLQTVDAFPDPSGFTYSEVTDPKFHKN